MNKACSLTQIYKDYKHGNCISKYSIHRVYKALDKIGELQVVLVCGYNKNNLYVHKLYNYIPEDDRFVLILEE